jgi:hypothetical protein
MRARGDQGQEMTLAGPVCADKAHKARVIIELKFDVLKISPLIDSYSSYAQYSSIAIGCVYPSFPTTAEQVVGLSPIIAMGTDGAGIQG